MKAVIGILAAALLGAAGYYLVSREDKTHRSNTIHKSLPPAPPTSTLNDPAEVFQKAFWKRPAANDKILHTERREWADAEGVQRWQWFIVVEPSAELVKHLREDNAFSLVPTTAIPEIPDAPAWFAPRPAEVEILQAPQANMRLFFNKTKPLLFATDSGSGFHPGAPEPAKPLPVQAPVGRLPNAQPPTPPKN